MPLDNKVRILASRDAITSYMKNDYRTKFERPCFSGVVSPMTLDPRRYCGAILYNDSLGSIE